MTAAALVLLPLLAGGALWAWPWPDGEAGEAAVRRGLGLGGAATLLAVLGLAVVAAVTEASATLTWSADLALTLRTPPLAGVVAVAVPAVALPAAVYAAWHEPADELPRLVGLLVAFVGTMQLLVLAEDLLTVLVAWELVAALSWALIGHEHRDATRPRRAAHAFNGTRVGGLGLVLAAGAAFAGTGELGYAALARLDGGLLDVVAAGVVAAAVAKSAQLPFSPWLFSAMAGPTPVSALLHSATMVAAGAYLLLRLEPVLAAVGWFGPLVLTIGLATALLGGVVAVLQSQAKHLLAASTSAQYGLMFVAVGAGYPAVAAAHLVAHAAFKALLFLAAGVAIQATGSPLLARMRLGSHRRTTAAAALVGSLALAAVPPLGAAWSKEEVLAAGTHAARWAGVLVVVAGGLSALYAARFQLLTFGRTTPDASPRDLLHPPGRPERAALWWLAALTVLLGAVWLPPVEHLVERLGELPGAAPWELPASLTAVAVAGYAAVVGERRGWLATLGSTGRWASAAGWLGLPVAIRVLLVDPGLALARGAARFDDVVLDRAVTATAALAARAAERLARGDTSLVDGVVRGVAGATRMLADTWGRLAELGVDGAVAAVAGGFAAAGRDARRLQTGAAHHYLTIVVIGTASAVLVAALWG